MKSIIKYFMLTFLMTVLCLFSMQAMAQESGQINADQIKGGWSMNYDKSHAELSQDKKSRVANKKTESKDRLKKAYDRKFSFLPNQKFNMKLGNGRTIKGEWSLQEDGKVLRLVYPNNRERLLKVISYSKDGLHLEIQTTSQTLVFTHWWLTKN